MSTLNDLTPILSNSDIKPFPGTTPYMAQNFKDIGTQTIISFFIGSFGMIVFYVLRRYWPEFYSPRSRLKRGAPPKLNNSVYKWIFTVWKTPEREILKSVGLDAVIFLRYFKIMIMLFSVISICNIFIVAPIDASLSLKNYINSMEFLSSAETKKSFWSALASSLLRANDAYVIQLIFSYIYVGLVYIFIAHFSFQIAFLRWNYLLLFKESIPARTIMVSEIPQKLNTSAALKKYFEQNGVGAVQTCCILPLLYELDNLLEKRANILFAIEKRYASLLGNPAISPNYDPTLIKECFYSNSVDSRHLEKILLLQCAKPKYLQDQNKLDAWLKSTHQLSANFFQIEKEIIIYRHRTLNEGLFIPSRVAFVSFESPKSAQIAAQLCMFPNPTKLKIKMAPEPRDVYWANVSSPLKYRLLRTAFLAVFVLFISVFWLVPISFLSSLVSPEFIDSYFPGFLKYLKSNPLLNTFFKLTLPSLILYAFNETMPLALDYLNRISGTRTISERQFDTIQQYYGFLIISVLLIFSLSKLVLGNLYDMIENPSEIPKLLADALPDVAPFFMGYTAMLGLGYYPLKLSRIGAVVLSQVRWLISFCPRDYLQCVMPEYTKWEYLYPQTMLIFTIAMTYSSIAPLIAPFAVLYFSIGFIINKYLIMYVYTPRYESAGFYIYKILKNLVRGMFIYILLMLGIFGLRKQYTLFVLELILLLINIYVLTNISEFFGFGRRFIPLDMFTDQKRKYLKRFKIFSKHNKTKKTKKNKFSYRFTLSKSDCRYSDFDKHTSGYPDPTTSLLDGSDYYSDDYYSKSIVSLPTFKTRSISVDDEELNKISNAYYNNILNKNSEINGYIAKNNTSAEFGKKLSKVFESKLDLGLMEPGSSHNSFPQDSLEFYVKTSKMNFIETSSVNDCKIAVDVGSSPNLARNNAKSYLDTRAHYDRTNFVNVGYYRDNRFSSIVENINYDPIAKPNNTEPVYGNSLISKLKIKFEELIGLLQYYLMDQFITLDIFDLDDQSDIKTSSQNSATTTNKQTQYNNESNKQNSAKGNSGDFASILNYNFATSSSTNNKWSGNSKIRYNKKSPTGKECTELRWWGSTEKYLNKPSEYSDYSQPAMDNFYGILDAGNAPYMNPQLVGELPTLWLPSKKEI
ncbi:hypothetical protein BB561_001842 [Smittium simulii]|uniref:CSC1/OSCA1-like 7TM region domain-containing protein n=1 Tax=Smittium simulii TaxID=133385 RepID=A0A2T9YSS1_9FUNG|nr:hypothetical protein BB561_001842 [Smittium simulii]